MTEALPATDITLGEIERALADAEAGADGVCVGRPLPGVRLALDPLDVAGRPTGALVTGSGVTGEICVAAAHVKDHYDRLWSTQQRSATPAGWHRTGDVGHLDEQGRLWVEGRLVHVITGPAGPVTPVGIEQRVEAVYDVGLAAAVGVGPAGTQQTVVVLATGRPTAPLAAPDLAAAVRTAAGVPVAAVLVTDRLPVDIRHASKIDRARVARWAEYVLAGRRPAGRGQRDRAGLRILVTGGRSLLGAGVARRLAGRGDHVTVLQRRAAGLGLPEVLADLADREAVQRAVAGQDVVVHLAAKVGISGGWPEFLRTNVAGTDAVVQACLGLGIPRLVHVSSPSVAHTGTSLVGAGAGPADPDHARGHYARSKAMAEQVALAADGPTLRVIAIRPHLVWGPGDTQLVARIVDRARRGTLPILGTGAALVDTTYLDNAVDALVAAVDRVETVHGRALVVSNGEPRPIGEILAAIATAGGAAPPSRHVPAAVGTLAGAAVEAVWAVRQGLGRPAAADPPMTRFLAEQLSTAHWFDQRETQQLLEVAADR